mmetsp:Transcript_1877/g.3296  ORF Transcript_1877/g.3296 Transcript_1877/m.3296 type:complete len:219 (+) Transcript_1877:98-754(+)
MLAPPRTRASISSSEKTGRPYVESIIDPSKTTVPLGVSGSDWGVASFPDNLFAQPSLPRKEMEGCLAEAGGTEVAGAAAAVGAVSGEEEDEASAAVGLSAASACTVATPSVSISYKFAPTSTVSSTAPKCWTITPSTSALMSTVTLSVSKSATTSSVLTACPTAAVHSTIVPSVIESPMVGTFIVTFSIKGEVYANTKRDCPIRRAADRSALALFNIV